MPPLRPGLLRAFASCFLGLAAFGPTVPAQEPADDADLRKQLALAERLLNKASDRAAVLYFIAGTHALLHEPHEAVASLKECILAKEGFDPSGDAIFAGLKTSPDFQHLTEQVHREFPEVSHAHLAFTTVEKDLVPEGLAYDPAEDAFYLSSLHRKKIVRISREAPNQISDFVPADRDHLLPVLGIRMDPTDATVWSASWLDNGPTELLHFDRNGSLLGRFSLGDERKHGFNDLVVLRNGLVYVTDTADNQVFRFDPKSRSFEALEFPRELLMPNGIALTDDEKLLYVADQFGIFRYDLRSGYCIELKPGASSTLSGADGLYWHKGSLVTVQNGIGSPRIAAFQLAADGLRVTKTTVLENRSAFSTLPTTGAIRGDDFYFIVNSQVDNLNGDRVLDVTRLAPVRIAMLPLP
jgi:sugar lactone lactonase YvrE